ncbi:MAG: molybdopterin-dependent oxidoreductase, partial [Anaerolineales bacterium]
ENFYATTQERGQVHDVEMALSKDGKILGLKDDFIHDSGAYDPYGLTIPLNTQCHALGPYEIPNFDSELHVVFTNKTLTTPVRGAGRPHGVFVVERMLDIAARELGIDPTEIRKRNFLPNDVFPYDNVIIDQAFANFIIDSGDYLPALEKALEMIGYKQFLESEQPKARAEGRKLGIGVVSFIETTGVGPYEGARVTVESSGEVSVATGVGTQGQGHFTSFAQVVAEHLGVNVSDVNMVTGDTSQFHWGTGTFASRGAVVAANAMNAASSMVRKKILELASELLEAPEEELEIEDGEVRVADIPRMSISLGELAQKANPLRGAVEPGTEPGLEATAYFGPNYGATAFGTHAMVVEVDPETMDVKIKRYVVVEDCGTVLNPLILEGQVHGGVAHGIGNAFYEQLFFDENGQLLNASFADYLIPTAAEIPPIEVGHTVTPSPLNPLGSKGAGEAGAIPVPALLAQAIENALDEDGFEILESPMSPLKLFELYYGEKER